MTPAPDIVTKKDSDVGFLEQGARMSIRVQFYIGTVQYSTFT